MGAHISHPIYQKSRSARLKLEATVCRECDTVAFPPKESCPSCGGTKWTETTLSGTGTVYSYTIITPGGAPPEFSPQAKRTGKFAVAVIELAEGPHITAQLTNVDLEDVTIGMPVSATVRRLYVEEEIVRYGFKFEPTDSSA